MTTSQSGVLTEASATALFITADIASRDGALAAARSACAAIPALTRQLAARDPQTNLLSVVAIGQSAWQALTDTTGPQELDVFKARADGLRKAPSTPTDLFFHIRSERADLNFELAKQLRRLFGDSIEVRDEQACFRYFESRDLTGFVDGTENPEGEERAEVALISNADPAYTGGSYVLLQRYIHNLQRWDKLPQTEQESVIGRTRDTDEELDDDIKPATAHISRVVIEEDGEELEILRHSLPYGNSSKSGLMFVAYSHNLSTFEKMLDAMYLTDSHGGYDHLMDFTRAVSGAYYFAPSIEMLEGLA